MSGHVVCFCGCVERVAKGEAKNEEAKEKVVEVEQVASLGLRIGAGATDLETLALLKKPV